MRIRVRMDDLTSGPAKGQADEREDWQTNEEMRR